MPNFKKWAYFRQRQWGMKVRRKKEIYFWGEKIRNKFSEQHDIRWATEQEWTAEEKSITYPLGRSAWKCFEVTPTHIKHAWVQKASIWIGKWQNPFDTRLNTNYYSFEYSKVTPPSWSALETKSGTSVIEELVSIILGKPD